MSARIKYDGAFLKEVVKHVQEGLEKEVMRPAAKFASTRIAARSSSTYMRRAGAVAGATFGTVGKRSRDDQGPLRIVTSRLVRSILNRAFGGRRESVNELKAVGSNKLLLSKGTSVPYSLAHEKGFSGEVDVPAHTRKHPSAGDVRVKAHQRSMTVPARPYLGPALRDEEPGINNHAGKIFLDFVKRCVKRAAGRRGL